MRRLVKRIELVCMTPLAGVVANVIRTRLCFCVYKLQRHGKGEHPAQNDAAITNDSTDAESSP